MKSIDELKNEALSELQLQRENEAKDSIKNAIRGICEQQKVIAVAKEKIAKHQADIKAVTLDPLDVQI